MLRTATSTILTLIIVLTGCKPASGPTDSDVFMTLTDGLDRSVILKEAPTRVVSIAPGATHIIRSAGGLSKLVAVTTADYDDTDLAHLPRVSALPLDLEAIVALNPDLVVASDQVNDPSHADLFDALDIPIVYLDSDSWDDVRSSISQVGRMLSTEEAASMASDSLQQQVDELIALTRAVDQKPSAVFLISNVRSYSFGRGSYVLDLMEWAGLDPLTDEFDTPAPVLEDEWVLLRNPDVIVGTFPEGKSPIDGLLEHHPTWHTLDAIREGRIVSVPVPTVLTPGPENVRAAWHMARQAHPDLFNTSGQ